MTKTKLIAILAIITATITTGMYIDSTQASADPGKERCGHRCVLERLNIIETKLTPVIVDPNQQLSFQSWPIPSAIAAGTCTNIDINPDPAIEDNRNRGWCPGNSNYWFYPEPAAQTAGVVKVTIKDPFASAEGVPSFDASIRVVNGEWGFVIDSTNSVLQFSENATLNYSFE